MSDPKIDLLYEIRSRILEYAKAQAAELGLGAIADISAVGNNSLHLRLTVYGDDAESQLAKNWESAPPEVGLPPGMAPGDELTNSSGKTITIVGLDPISASHPVRVRLDDGQYRLMTIEALSGI